MQLTHDLAAVGIQGREQGSGAVSDIAMYREFRDAVD
jgi:hypothetical protein